MFVIVFSVLTIVVVGGICTILWILHEVDKTMKKVR